MVNKLPCKGTNMTWTIQQGARWLPPKNIGGRRWYQDDAGLIPVLRNASDVVMRCRNGQIRGRSTGCVKPCPVQEICEYSAPEDEHADPARNLYNEIMSAPGTVRHANSTILCKSYKYFYHSEKCSALILQHRTGGGTALRTRISNPGQKLLRQDAKLDEPDKCLSTKHT